MCVGILRLLALKPQLTKNNSERLLRRGDGLLTFTLSRHPLTIRPLTTIVRPTYSVQRLGGNISGRPIANWARWVVGAITHVRFLDLEAGLGSANSNRNRRFRDVMTEPTDTFLIASLLPATLIPDSRMSDEDLELALAVELDAERIRCERSEQGKLRLYAPTPESIWLMIQMLQRKFLAWIDQMRTAGQIAIRRRLFLGECSMMCPDLAYFAPDANNSPVNIGAGTALRIYPICVIEICPHSRELRWFRDRMLLWMASGIRVSLLVVPHEHCAYVYKLGAEPKIIDGDYACGNGRLEGFEIKLSELWSLHEYKRTY